MRILNVLQFRTRAFAPALIATAVFAASCGGSNSAAGPTAPSSSQPSSSASGQGVSLSGTVTGALSTSSIKALSAPLVVTITGTSLTTSVDGSGHFTLQGVPSGTIDLHFTGAGVDAHIELDDVADQGTIQITVHVSGGTADLDDDERAHGNEIEVEGLVTAISPASITVNGKTFAIVSTTRLDHDGSTITVDSIHVGDRVHVHGTMVGTTQTATRVQLKNQSQLGNPGAGHGNDGGGSGHGNDSNDGGDGHGNGRG